MTTIYLVRHAEAEGNIMRVFHGQHDSDITPGGAAQLKLLERRFENVHLDAIYSSDLKRARKTAEAVRGVRDMKIRLDSRLREIKGGLWEGVGWDELVERFPESYYTWEQEPWRHQMPLGESMAQVRERMAAAISDIAGQNDGRTICIATHGTAMKAFMTYALGWELERFNDVAWYDNTSVTVLRFEKGKFEVVSQNDVEHLPADMRTLSKQKWWIPKGREERLSRASGEKK